MAKPSNEDTAPAATAAKPANSGTESSDKSGNDNRKGKGNRSNGNGKGSNGNRKGNGKGNGVAWLALLCALGSLGGLAAGGYAYYQNALSQKIAAEATAKALATIAQRVGSAAKQTNDKLAEVADDFAQNAAALVRLQAKITAVQNQKPMALQQQVQVLQAEGQALQQQSLESIKQLALQTGQRVARWQQQELAAVLATIERNLAETGDTARAAAGLKRLAQAVRLLNDTAYIELRLALVADIARLESAQSVDLDGIYQQLSSLSAQVAGLPFLQDARLNAARAKTNADDSATGGDGKLPAANQGLWAGLWADLRSVVKIQHIDETPSTLLDSQAKLLVNETMRLSLKFAQLALFNKNNALFQAEIASALAVAKQYFASQSAALMAWSAALNDLAALNLSPPPPSLAKSKAALAQVIALTAPPSITPIAPPIAAPSLGNNQEAQ